MLRRSPLVWLVLGFVVSPYFTAPAKVHGQDKSGQVQDGAESSSSASLQRIRQEIDMIAKGEQKDRQAILCQLLEKAGFTPELLPFEKRTLKGTNIKVVLPVGQEAPTRSLLLGAHYDRVKAGQGIIDNGCGCIALMELIQRLAKEPLSGFQVTAIFFDLEEVGLVGSADYAKNLSQKPELFMNLDVFAYGRQMWLNTNSEEDAFTQAAKRVDEANVLTFEHGKEYPPSDHLSFRREGIESVSFSLLPAEEVAEVEAMFRGDRSIQPKILKTIHTADDLPSKANPEDMLEGINYLESTLREWGKRK